MNKLTHKKKEFIENQRKGETYVSKLGKNACIEPQNISQVFIFIEKFLTLDLNK
jgi:hypothetical protein